MAGRGAVYGQAPRGGSVRAFVTRGYWRRIAERPLLILVAWLLLLAPAAAGALWAASDPGGALGFVPGELQAAADPPSEGRDYDAATGAAFSAQVMVNNIQVTLTAFAGGIFAGAGTVLALLFNGTDPRGGGRARVRRGQRRRVPAPAVLARAARALLHRGRRHRRAAAGLGDHRAGPRAPRAGRRRRGAATPSSSPSARRPGSCCAAVAEGFLTGPNLPVAVQLGIGASLFALFWGLVVWRGRTSTRAERRVSPA